MNLQGNLVSLETPQVMGVLNITPDSFYAGSRYQTPASLLKQAEGMLKEGALILDVGGYSSRPGAGEVTEEEEYRRVIRAIGSLRREFPKAYVSIDTFRASIAKSAVEAGACLINDISGGSMDTAMYPTVAALQVPYVLMHMRGTPQTMTGLTRYDHLLREIALYFAQKADRLARLGVRDVIIDPGFGFAKTPAQNYEILQNLDYFKALNLPILAGISRKSMICKELGITPEEALNGTTALNMIALMNGANLLRVHDVKEAMETVRLYKATYP